jgi:hypothetical protein
MTTQWYHPYLTHECTHTDTHTNISQAARKYMNCESEFHSLKIMRAIQWTKPYIIHFDDGISHLANIHFLDFVYYPLFKNTNKEHNFSDMFCAHSLVKEWWNIYWGWFFRWWHFALRMETQPVTEIMCSIFVFLNTEKRTKSINWMVLKPHIFLTQRTNHKNTCELCIIHQVLKYSLSMSGTVTSVYFYDIPSCKFLGFPVETSILVDMALCHCITRSP